MRSAWQTTGSIIYICIVPACNSYYRNSHDTYHCCFKQPLEERDYSSANFTLDWTKFPKKLGCQKRIYLLQYFWSKSILIDKLNGIQNSVRLSKIVVIGKFTIIYSRYKTVVYIPHCFSMYKYNAQNNWISDILKWNVFLFRFLLWIGLGICDLNSCLSIPFYEKPKDTRVLFNKK